MLVRFFFFILWWLSNSCFASDDSDLNLDFFYGSDIIPTVLKSNTSYPPGSYFVDVFVNNERTGKIELNVSESESHRNALCLDEAWLKKSNVPIRISDYSETFHASGKCYELSKKPHTRVDFDYASQVLKLSVPQMFLLGKTDKSMWDYGVNAGRLRYSGNFMNASKQKTSYYGYGDLLLNIRRWNLNSNINVTKNSAGQQKITVGDITVSTPVSPVLGDLILGKSFTRSGLFSDFGFYGVALRSNSSMKQWESRGYAPLISGIAARTSRITVSQNGYVVYSKIVPPGPYRLHDLRPVGNGELVVVTEDESGHQTRDVYPVTTLPDMLRTGDMDFNFAVGKKSSGYELKNALSHDSGMFWLGNWGYGLLGTTFNSALILHPKYRGAGVGLTRDMGTYGAFSLSENISYAQYLNGEKKGHSVSAKYAKAIGDTTDLQLLAYRYQSLGYVDFANFSRYPYASRKSRYEAIVSQRLGSSLFGMSVWQEDYWKKQGVSRGGNLSFGTSVFGDAAVFLNGSYSHNPYGSKADYSSSISISVPFTVHGRRHYSSGSVSYGSTGTSSLNSSVSAELSERAGYSLRTSADSQKQRAIGGSVDYAFDLVQTTLSLDKSRYGRNVSGSVSGQLLITQESGLMLTKESSRTLGVVRLPDVKGVRFNGSQPTNSRGFTVVGLSSYGLNNINIDMNDVPNDLSMQTTSYQVVPVENAVIYRQFGAEHVKRYVLRVRDSRGRLLTGGHAVTEQGLEIGHISINGVLMMDVLAEPDSVRVDISEGRSCHFSIKGKTPSVTRVQEVKCDE
ncbi:PefC/AfrB family outer membrane usher protein [Escherichia albertii]|uniref:PefC/AfrB family outer membrane usher protein n=1 Tax=Escherichia albertii TaxID=208962 RepID=UPI0010F6BA42|nr:PefC/AfrB family outer membrane usher protein [Escherichia albertii]